jgi:hypothetical protein
VGFLRWAIGFFGRHGSRSSPFSPTTDPPIASPCTGRPVGRSGSGTCAPCPTGRRTPRLGSPS